MTRYRISFFLLSFLCLIGCARREHQGIPASFYNTPSVLLIVETKGLKTPHYTVANQGANAGGMLGAILVEVVNSIAVASNQAAANEVQATDVSGTVSSHYYEPFIRSFAAKNVTVQVLKNAIELETLKEGPGDLKFASYDFTYLKAEKGADFALIMEPRLFGITRIPGLWGQSIRNANLQFSLVNLKTNAIVAYYDIDLNEAIEGEWDHPPYYPVLTKGMKETLQRALTDAHRFFMR